MEIYFPERKKGNFVLKSENHSVWLFATPWTIYGNSPGQNTGVDSLSLLQGIFPTQRLNPGLPHCRQISLPAESQEKPLFWILDFVLVLEILELKE